MSVGLAARPSDLLILILYLLLHLSRRDGSMKSKRQESACFRMDRSPFGAISAIIRPALPEP
jgi:hypothetical protein